MKIIPTTNKILIAIFKISTGLVKPVIEPIAAIAYGEINAPPLLNTLARDKKKSFEVAGTSYITAP